MRAVARGLALLRHGARNQIAFLFAGAFAGLLAAGSFRVQGGAPLPWYALATLGIWGAVFTRSAYARFREERDAADLSSTASNRTLRFVLIPRLRADFEIGILLLVLTFAIVELAGGVTSPVYPMVYVLVAFYVSFYPRLLGLALALTTILIETAIVVSRHGMDSDVLFIHAGFIGFFALLNLVFTHTEIFRLRHRGEMRLRHALERVRQAARDFRLIEATREGFRPSTIGQTCESRNEPDNDAAAGASDRRSRNPLRGATSSVHQIQETLYDTLDLLKQTLSLHTCIVLWLDSDGARLKLAEVATDAEEIDLGPYGATEGAIGAVLRSCNSVTLGGLRPDYRGLPYYRGPVPVGSFLATPVSEGGSVRGVLIGDRLNPEAFGERERAILGRAADRVARTIQNERAFLQLEKAKVEQGCLYAASERLSGAIQENDVFEGALDAARMIADFDLGAVAVYDARSGRHRIRHVAGQGAERLVGLTFDDNAGLVSMAVRAKHYLPYRGDFDARSQIVWAEKNELRSMESLLVLPLVSRESPIGTLTLAAHRRGAFREDARTLLGVLANQVATSLLNAWMVRKLAEAATTDGLTGLLNRRTFDGEIERHLRSADRYHKPVSVILCDLDHFKEINDTYGHQTGDDVLRGFAEVLMRCKRDLDLVARWGGEEFAILCDETDAAGARLLAERIRAEMGARPFRGENVKQASGYAASCRGGPGGGEARSAEQPPGLVEFRVTCSLGVATCPQHGRDRETLVERADHALYAAKQAGRNRTVLAPIPP